MPCTRKAHRSSLWIKWYAMEFCRLKFKIFVVQSLVCAGLFETMDCSMPGSLSTNSQSLLKLMPIGLVMLSNHLIICWPLLSSIFPNIKVFSSELALCIRWPKYWSFSFSIIPSNEYSGLISLMIDWFDLLAVQGLSRIFPIPQFKITNSLVLSLLYGPTHIQI